MLPVQTNRLKRICFILTALFLCGTLTWSMVFLLRKPLGEALESVVRKVERQEYLIKISRHNQTPSEMMAVDNAMEHVPWPGGSGSRRLQFGRWHWNNSRYSTRVGLNEPRLDDDLFRVMNLGD